MRRVLFALLCAASCHTQAAPGDGPAGDGRGPQGSVVSAMKLPVGNVRFETPRGPWVVKVEVANTDESRSRGLMFRRDLAPDSGMVFVFPSTEEHAFWMHDTLIALDMIFLGEERRVLGVVTAPPMTDTPRTVQKPSRYVIEVAAGMAAAHAIGPGTPVAFIDVAE